MQHQSFSSAPQHRPCKIGQIQRTKSNKQIIEPTEDGYLKFCKRMSHENGVSYIAAISNYRPLYKQYLDYLNEYDPSAGDEQNQRKAMKEVKRTKQRVAVLQDKLTTQKQKQRNGKRMREDELEDDGYTGGVAEQKKKTPTTPRKKKPSELVTPQKAQPLPQPPSKRTKKKSGVETPTTTVQNPLLKKSKKPTTTTTSVDGEAVSASSHADESKFLEWFHANQASSSSEDKMED